jgi:UDP-N-acetylglucosamine/UDP-N-acetylgalactosamine diphosphorylase
MSSETIEAIEKTLKKHDQSHLLTFWQQLNAEKQQNLLSQLENLDFSQIDNWVDNFVKKDTSHVLPSNFAPAEFYSLNSAKHQDKYSKAIKLGKELISAGKVAGFVVAGGQGTRLGFEGPKGNFPLSPIKNKTLFQLFAETIAAVSKKYNTICPWYVMTSPLNYTETCEIFEQNNYYGLDRKNIFIFQQGTLPNFGVDGKILMADKERIACSPDGHGGSLKALYKSGAIEDMQKRGVEFISYWQIDNSLVNLFDPLFIGLHAMDGSDMSSKTLIKAEPKEKVGNFCAVDGKVTVIEYSDLPDELAEKRNPDGSLVFRLGSIAIHLISRSFVEKLNSGGFSLGLHKAVKKIPYIDKAGELVNPAEPNGVKLESFVFDALPLASNSMILEIGREEEFAPLKNATGIDSAQTARQMLIDRAASWLESAGVKVPRKADGAFDCIIELASSFAAEKADVRSKLGQIPDIKPGDKLYLA